MAHKLKDLIENCYFTGFDAIDLHDTVEQIKKLSKICKTIDEDYKFFETPEDVLNSISPRITRKGISITSNIDEYRLNKLIPWSQVICEGNLDDYWPDELAEMIEYYDAIISVFTKRKTRIESALAKANKNQEKS